MTDNQNQAREALKPCPFCGADAFIEKVGGYPHGYGARCSNDDCHASLIYQENYYTAAKAWNKRPEADPHEAYETGFEDGTAEALQSLSDAKDVQNADDLGPDYPYAKGWVTPVQAMSEDAAALAQRFHEAYERLAPDFGYKTREASAKPWAEVPEQNKNLMIAVCAEILTQQRKPDAGAA